MGIRTAGMKIVRQSNPGGDEHIVLYGGELGDIDLVMNLDAVPDPATVVDNGVVPDTEAIADFIFFPDNDIVARLQVRADPATAINNSSTANAGTRTDGKHLLHHPTGRITQDYLIVDNSPITELHRLIINL
jgi:hypothetical protein